MYFSLQQQNRAFTIFTNAKYLTFEPHLHSHIELVFMREGGKTVCFADDKSDILEEGDLFLAFPNQVHYYEDTEKPINADVLIISPAMCPEFKSFFEKYLPQSPVLKHAKDNPVILSSLNILAACASRKDEFAETMVRGSLLVLLSEYFRVAKLEKNHSKTADATKDIINFCYENYTNDISLQSIADRLHISRYYISHLFSKRLRVSFNDYINSLRVRKACELLKSGEMSVTETAHTVGYNSVRTFDRCFQKVRGITPREYRTKHLKKEKETR